MLPKVILDYPRSPVTPEIAAIALPRVAKARQRFVGPEVDDVAAAVHAEVERAGLGRRFAPGARVAITVGSRGIGSIPRAAAALVAEVRRLGGDPFIVPAMGSHGGATAEGQLGILEEIGVTERTVEAPILASMEVVELGRLAGGMPVYLDKHAYEADAIILLNRIKPHSPWGHIGSGLMKVSTIGLGKQKGCNTIHSWAVGTARLYHIIAEAYQVVRQKAPVVLGVGIVDNHHARPARIVALAPEEIADAEPALCREANAMIARLPFDRLDVAVFDVMGKNVSPGGLDHLVVGRPEHDPEGRPVESQPKFKSIVVLDLTPQSHGNAIGIGEVDIATRRLASKINFYDTYMNSISACSASAVRLPMILPSDREALQIALLTTGCRQAERARLARARSTLHLEEFYFSEALLSEVKELPQVEQLSDPAPMVFDAEGNLR